MTNFRVCYTTHEFDDIDIHTRTLRDNQQFYDENGVAEKLGISSASWPLFGIIWPSSLVLAHHLLDFDFEGKRILEVGCGIGLASLLLNHLGADITATDYHPEAGRFLEQNAALNQDDLIPFVRTGWGDPITDVGKFDLIIGSDILYEDHHIDLLIAFIEQHCKAHSHIILVDPGRGRLGKFGRKMTEKGFSRQVDKPGNVDYLDKPFKGSILSFTK